MNNNQNGNNMNASNTIGFEYSQQGSLIKATLQGKKAGQEWTKAFIKELNNGLKKDLKNFEGLTKPMNDLKKNFVKTASEMESALGKSFSKDSLKTYNKYIDDVDKTIKSLIKTTENLNTETAKAEPNGKVLIKLAEDKTKAENEVNKLLSSRQLILEKIDLLTKQQVATDAMKAAKSKEEREKAQKDYDNITDSLLEIDLKLAGINKTLEEGAQNLGNHVDRLNAGLNKFRDSLGGVSSKVDKVSNAVGTINTAVDRFFNVSSIDKQIQMWDRELDRYTKMTIDINNSFGNLSTFESYKNNIISSQPDGLYNSNQLLEIMKDMSTYSFKNTEIAERMSKDLAFAKNYMGVSNESLHGLYELQVRTGQDDFLKKSLNSITTLQKSGISISQEQLNHAIESSKTLTDRLLDMGLGTEQVNRVMAQLTTAQEQADVIYGPGTGDLLMKTIEKSLSADEIGLFAANPNSALNKLMNEDVGEFINDIFSGPLAKASNNINMNNPLNAMIASEGGGFINGSDNTMRRLGDETKLKELTEAVTASKNSTDEADNSTKSLDETVQDIINTLPEKLKEGNIKSEELLTLNWKSTSDQIAVQKDIDTNLQRITQKISLVTSVMTLAISATNILISSMNALAASNSASGIGDAIGNLAGGKGSKFKGLLKAGGKALGSFGKTAIRAGGMYAGVQAISNMTSDGMTGLVDQSTGEQIEKTSWKDTAAAAVGGSEVKAEGQNIGSSALSGLGKGASVGAMIGSFVGPLGTIIGAGIGGLAGTVLGCFAGSRKDKKAAELAQKKRDEERDKLLEVSNKNLAALKNQRDVALSDRYSDGRFGTGAPEGVMAMPYVAPKKDDLPRGGVEAGVDIDGFKKTAGWPKYSSGSAHSGMDFAKAHNSPIGAAYAGEVINVGTNGAVRHSDNDKYGGNFVQVYHPDKDITATYYHFSSVNAKKGDIVSAGDTIGFQGNTGHVIPHPGYNESSGKTYGETAGSHLHYEIHPGKTTSMGAGNVNPANYLTSDIFYADGTAPVMTQDYNSSSSGSRVSNSKGYNASVVRSSNIPTVKGGTGGPDGNSTVSATDFKSSSLEEKLDTINNTLLNMTERQDKQQRILDALSINPIHNFGV